MGSEAFSAISLYGHNLCTDHEVLKSLLNTPHPSEKLARWGLALQEVDLHIHYRPGKKNANADALSHCPLLLESTQANQSNVFAIVSAISIPQFPAKDWEADVSTRQQGDPELLEVITFLVEGTLPKDEKQESWL